MKTELISAEPGLRIHRATLEPGEATAWHRDACRRFTVVVRGDELTIEYRDGDPVVVSVHPGLAGWDEPTDRVHRAINTGRQVFEEVVTFLLESDEQVPQPEAD